MNKDYRRRLNGTYKERDTSYKVSEFLYGCVLIVIAFGLSALFYYGF